MARVRIPVALALLAATGCGARPHVKLAAPPARVASVSERLGAYQRPRPVKLTFVPRGRNADRRITSVILGDRERVFHPEGANRQGAFLRSTAHPR